MAAALQPPGAHPGQHADPGRALLDVLVRHPRDVAGALAGGADRLHLVATGVTGVEGVDGDPERHGTSPEPAVASAVCREAALDDVPVHVVLRLSPSWTTTGGELMRLVGLAEDYLRCGAAGVSFGFLDVDLEVDLEVCAALVGRLPGVPWTFTAAVDDALDPRRAWRALRGLPGLVAVCTGGSPRGLGEGFDELLAAVEADPVVAALAMPGPGLSPEQVPWLARAGVRQFRLGAQARPGGSWRADVDAAHVRSWRLLLDRTVERLARPAVTGP